MKAEKKEKDLKSSREKIKAQYIERRREMWPSIPDEDYWDKGARGFTSIPRTMPLLMKIMDGAAQGGPVSRTYHSLWCRMFDDQAVLKLDRPRELAFEAGFSHQRAESTWLSRMKELRRLGFIHSAEGPNGEFDHVCLPNPYFVVAELKRQGKVPAKEWNALLTRVQDIGAKDLKNAKSRHVDVGQQAS